MPKAAATARFFLSARAVRAWRKVRAGRRRAMPPEKRFRFGRPDGAPARQNRHFVRQTRHIALFWPPLRHPIFRLPPAHAPPKSPRPAAVHNRGRTAANRRRRHSARDAHARRTNRPGPRCHAGRPARAAAPRNPRRRSIRHKCVCRANRELARQIVAGIGRYFGLA